MSQSFKNTMTLIKDRYKIRLLLGDNFEKDTLEKHISKFKGNIHDKGRLAGFKDLLDGKQATVNQDYDDPSEYHSGYFIGYIAGKDYLDRLEKRG